MTFALSIHVFGTVQGVFFRAETKSLADKLGIFGWVKNLPDKSVEIFAEGEKENLDRFLDWCYHGPKNASVTELEFGWVKSKNFKEFSIR